MFGAQLATSNEVQRQIDGLRQSAGWFAISLAFWLIGIGLILLLKMERGRPS